MKGKGTRLLIDKVNLGTSKSEQLLLQWLLSLIDITLQVLMFQIAAYHIASSVVLLLLLGELFL